MSNGLRRLLTGLAVVSLAATTGLFIRATRPFSASQRAAAHAHLTAADLGALADPIAYAEAIPVLNFHDVSTRAGAYSVTPSMFANQMAALRRAGFHTVSLEQARDLVLGRRPQLPARPVLLTFDDGVATEYTRADPILAANHFRAVSFVVPSRLGDGRKPSYYLSWPQVRALALSSRWEFGLRSDLADAEPATALTHIEPGDAAARLARATGTSPYAFSYPVASSALPSTKPRLMADIEQAVGRYFTLGFISDLRSPYAIDGRSRPLLLSRLEVTGSIDVPALFAALRHMVPSPPGSTVASWALSGPACRIGADGVTISAAGYALCRSQLNGARWTDYRLTMTVTGLTGKSTLVVLCRIGAAGDVELSLGSRLAVLRHLVRDRYRTLGSWPTLPPGPAGSHTVSLQVIGRIATVVVDGATLGNARVARRLAYGAPGLGIAGGGTLTVTAATATALGTTAATR